MRLHLALGILTAILLVITLRGSRQHKFAFADVVQLAEKRAQAKYAPLPEVMPPQLKSLTPDQDRGIFWKDKNRLWRKKGLPFQVDFYHPLNSNPEPHISPAIDTVDRKGAHLLAYSPSFFNFLNLTFNPPLPNNLGYAGFYVRYPLPTADEPKPGTLNGFFTTMGASYFRALAEDQVYGLSARGLAINAIDEKKEEFPVFTNWWLLEPGATATDLELYALLDSPSVSGAYRFTIHPGGVTSIDVHATLIFRQAVAQLGVAPFSSMYQFGENSPNHFGDNVHPEIHDSDGLIVQTSHGEWIWRPLEQASQRQIYNFEDNGPKGFGLVQRDRDFQHYQDLGVKYNVRPSAWVTPHSDWGKGAVQLTQAVTNNPNTDNVVAQWHPDHTYQPGEHLDLDYTIDWYMNDANRPPLAYAKATLVNNPAPAAVAPPNATPGAPSSFAKALPTPISNAPAPTLNLSAVPMPTGTTPVQFLVDFAGDGIENLPANAPPDLELTCNPPETGVREASVEKNGYGNSWRAIFTIVPARHFVPTDLQARLYSHRVAPGEFAALATPATTPAAGKPSSPGPVVSAAKAKAVKPDPKIQAAAEAAQAEVIARAKSGAFKLADWQKFLPAMGQADIYKDFGAPQEYGTDYWVYPNAVTGDQPNSPRSDLAIYFALGHAVACEPVQPRKPITETWTYTWHQ